MRALPVCRTHWKPSRVFTAFVSTKAVLLPQRGHLPTDAMVTFLRAVFTFANFVMLLKVSECILGERVWGAEPWQSVVRKNSAVAAQTRGLGSLLWTFTVDGFMIDDECDEHPRCLGGLRSFGQE